VLQVQVLDVSGPTSVRFSLGTFSGSVLLMNFFWHPMAEQWPVKSKSQVWSYAKSVKFTQTSPTLQIFTGGRDKNY